MRRGTTFFAAIAGLAAVPATSPAATIENTASVGPSAEDFVQYSAGKGERNRVTVRKTRKGYRVTDPGAFIRIKKGSFRGCSASGHTAFCRTDADNVSVALGDRNDSVRFKGVRAGSTVPATDPTTLAESFEDNEGGIPEATDVSAGPGDDVIQGSPGDDAILDGPGRDQVTAGGGDDLVLAAPDATPDRFDGGSGVNTVSYGSAQGFAVPVDKQPVTIDFSTGVAGVAGENDQVSNFQRGRGGEAGDTLIGGPGVEALFGGRGADQVSGGPGNDLLVGDDQTAPGFADKLVGGPGDDVLDGRDAMPGPTKTLECDDGADRIVSQPDSSIDASCKQAAYFLVGSQGSREFDQVRYDVLMPTRPASMAADGSPVFDVPCPGPLPGESSPLYTGCTGQLTLLRPGTTEVVGTGTFVLASGARGNVTATLTSAGAAAQAAHQPLTVRLTAELPFAQGSRKATADFGWQAALA
jgi:Ca2+-binding RTX toxin-like protein